jgi:hypothetical protein
MLRNPNGTPWLAIHQLQGPRRSDGGNRNPDLGVDRNGEVWYARVESRFSSKPSKTRVLPDSCAEPFLLGLSLIR